MDKHLPRGEAVTENVYVKKKAENQVIKHEQIMYVMDTHGGIRNSEKTNITN